MSNLSVVNAIESLGRQVAFYPSIARAFGDISTAVLVCQFIYWRKKVGTKEIYKTREEIEEETAIKPDAQRRIFKELTSNGFVEIIKKGLPARNYYRFNWEKIDQFVSDFLNKTEEKEPTTSGGETPMSSGGDSPRLDAANPHDTTLRSATTTSEITQEITTERDTPLIPQGGNTPPPDANASEKPKSQSSAKPKRRSSITFSGFLEQCQETGEKPIAEYKPVFEYAEKIGLPTDYLNLCWLEFKRRYVEVNNTKRYVDWRKAFLNCVTDNWYEQWAISREGEYYLTAKGKQANNLHGGIVQCH